MALQDKLDAYKKGFKKKAPPEALDIMHRAQEALEQSGILGKALATGDFAPDFMLKNYDGKEVRLSGLLASGPVVLGFYRGRW